MTVLGQQISGDPQLGKRLRRLRLERGLTQAELAKPRYTHAHISTIESGRRMPSPDALRFFAGKLGVELDELATGRPSGLTAEIKVDLQQARVLLSRGDTEAAKSRAESISRRAKEFDLPRIQARATEIEALAWERQGDPETALRRFRRAQTSLRGDAPTSRAVSIAGEVRCINDLGDPHHAVFVGENYIEHLQREQMDTPSAVLRVRSSLVLAYLSAGSLTEAGHAADECQRLIPKVNEPDVLAISYVNAAAVQVKRGHYADAEIALAKAEELFEALDLSYEAGTAMLARGISLSRGKNLAEARSVLQRAITLLSETGNTAQQANALMEAARVDRLAGHTDEAVERLHTALDLLNGLKQPRLEAWAHRELGITLTDENRARSERHLGRAIELYEEQNVQVELARTLVMLAELREPQDIEGQLEKYRLAAAAIHKISDT